MKKVKIRVPEGKSEECLSLLEDMGFSDFDGIRSISDKGIIKFLFGRPKDKAISWTDVEDFFERLTPECEEVFLQEEDKMKKHKWAEVITAFVNGEQIQDRYLGDAWKDTPFDFSLSVFDDSNYNFRIKPKMLMINDMEFPAPITEEPKEGTEVYLVVAHMNAVHCRNWLEHEVCLKWLKSGSLHLDMQSAEQHLAAVVQASRGH